MQKITIEDAPVAYSATVTSIYTSELTNNCSGPDESPRRSEENSLDRVSEATLMEFYVAPLRSLKLSKYEFFKLETGTFLVSNIGYTGADGQFRPYYSRNVPAAENRQSAWTDIKAARVNHRRSHVFKNHGHYELWRKRVFGDCVFEH